MATATGGPAGPVETRPRPIQIDFPGFEIRAGETVVDVGCGVGDVCVYAGHRGAHVVGLDVEQILVDRARESMADVPALSFRGIVSDCDPIPLEDASADVVVCTEVLEHVDDPARLLSELARIGRPGARYLISVPHPTSESLLRLVVPPWYFRRPFHIHVFEPDHLDDLLAGAGLAIAARHDSGFYWSMCWLLRMAAGMSDPYTVPEHPMLEAWDEVASQLVWLPKGPQVLRALDGLIPKSQVRIAVKAGGFRPGGPIRAWKRRLRDGTIRLGGFELRWRVRRSGR